MSNTQVFNISLPKIEAMFEKMKHEIGWDTDKKMYWGYYFSDHDLNRLESFGKNLKELGFEVVEIRNTSNDNLFLLHMEENVVHSAKSLFKQNHKLANLASENNIEIFDGWDVAPIQMDKGLVD